jgi:hypothetical protein
MLTYLLEENNMKLEIVNWVMLFLFGMFFFGTIETLSPSTLQISLPMILVVVFVGAAACVDSLLRNKGVADVFVKFVWLTLCTFISLGLIINNVIPSTKPVLLVVGVLAVGLMFVLKLERRLKKW